MLGKRAGFSVLAIVSGMLITCNFPQRLIRPIQPQSTSEPPINLLSEAVTPGITTYYIRPDGGTSEQCSGLADTAYPGSGSAQACAWDHPFRALPPGGPARIAGGSTLIIGNGSYMIGYGAPGSNNCEPDGAWECFMSPLPSGPDPAHPTRMLGAGWETKTGKPPELWGTERANYVLNLTGSSNVEVGWLEITDHSGCAEFHSVGLACKRENPPFGTWALAGLYAQDSRNVYLHELDIHGLAHTGIWAGRLTDWQVENVRISGNGWIGWDGDIEGEDAYQGTISFRHLTIEWSGCVETYPEKQPTACWGQEAGGYGDGLGTGTTGGHWIIEDSAFRHNAQDGIDLLYTRLPDGKVEIRRTISEGNAGNQIKTTGPTVVENSILVGNCGFFDQQSTWNKDDSCRAGGDALVLMLRPGDRASVINSTITGAGNVLVISACALDQKCNGSEVVILRNDIFLGNPMYPNLPDLTSFAWFNDESGDILPRNPFDVDYSLIYGNRFGNVTPCPGLHNLCEAQPGMVNTSLSSFDAHLQPYSPAINSGDPASAPPNDFDGLPRDAQPDIGAYEWR
jgi:hypothetical protein